MNSDGYVDWDEFATFLKWALHQYPKTEDPEVLLSIAFEKGIIPAMRVEEIAADDDASADTDGEDDE
jgi:hypothetical protein